jgi:hypothetical protein
MRSIVFVGAGAAGTCFGSGPELGFEPSQSTAAAPTLFPPNANAEHGNVKGAKDEDSKGQAYMLKTSEDEDKELNG